jgi:hypothetical protein
MLTASSYGSVRSRLPAMGSTDRANAKGPTGVAGASATEACGWISVEVRPPSPLLFA